MANGSKKRKYVPIGLCFGILTTFFKILYMPITTFNLKSGVSIAIDLFFFSYVWAGLTYIGYEYFHRKGREEIGLNDIVMIITFILSIGVYSDFRALFLTPF